MKLALAVLLTSQAAAKWETTVVCFRADGIDHAITIHSWSPLAEVVATPKEWKSSTLGGEATPLGYVRLWLGFSGSIERGAALAVGDGAPAGREAVFASIEAAIRF